MTKRPRRRKRRIRYDRIICLVLIAFAAMGFIDHFLGNDEKTEEVYTDPRIENTYNWSYLTQQDDRYVYDDGTYHVITGVDVSYAQGEIDWHKVKEDGIDFAMIRVGYRGYETGLLHTDVQLENNLNGAGEAGLKIGVYFFSSAITVEEAEEEARYTIGLIAYHNITAPIAYDMETVSDHDRYADLTYEEKTAIAAAFCRVIENAGYQAVVYGSDYWLRSEINTAQLQGHYNFWLAAYRSAPNYPYAFDMWQYTNVGSVNGIEGNVDLNLWFLD